MLDKHTHENKFKQSDVICQLDVDFIRIVRMIPCAHSFHSFRLKIVRKLHHASLQLTCG